MKIGILTHPLENNYGGILQNYALQQILLRMGHEVFTIDAHPQYEFSSLLRQLVGWANRMRLRFVSRHSVPITLNPLPSKEQFAEISKYTSKFIEQHIKLSRKIYSYTELETIDIEYLFDTYVFGSDQVWNSNMCPWMFGSFIKRKNVRKFSYAASFGHSDWKMNDVLTSECAAYAKEFEAISVREDSAVGLCSQYLGVNAKHVLDPTMLLTKEDYLKIIDVQKEDNVLFSYILDKTEDKQDIVSMVANRKQLNIRESMPQKEFVRGLTEINECVFPPVDQWLNSFNNAKFVVTDSFHGTVFAILFNKPFISIGNKRRGMARFESLLKMFSLEDRLVATLDETLSIIDKPIDYTSVNEQLELKREEALKFLSNIK